MTPHVRTEGEGAIRDILKGPHIKRLLTDQDCPPLVEIEPLQFFRVFSNFRRGKYRVASLPS